MLYIQHYIETVHFRLKYYDLAIVRKTTKPIEGGVVTVVFRTIGMLLLLRFLRFFYVFQNPKSRDFYVFLPVFRRRFLEMWSRQASQPRICTRTI